MPKGSTHDLLKAQLHSASGRSSKVIKDREALEVLVEVSGGSLVLRVDSGGGYSLRGRPDEIWPSAPRSPPPSTNTRRLNSLEPAALGGFRSSSLALRRVQRYRRLRRARTRRDSEGNPATS